VLDKPRVSRVEKASGDPPHQIEASVRGAQQKAASIGRHRAAVKGGDNGAPFNPSKNARFRATLPLHRAVSPNRHKSLSQNNFYLIRRPDALLNLRNAGLDKIKTESDLARGDSQ
jgi:hypothetical protein